jgi:sRNA-binding regulator protein Hfq
MGKDDKQKRRSAPMTTNQLYQELKALRVSHDQLKSTVNKHKDILNVQDNWHSSITPWLKKKVAVYMGKGVVLLGKLLWVDRYHIGLDIYGKKNILNKGHIERVRLAEESELDAC